MAGDGQAQTCATDSTPPFVYFIETLKNPLGFSGIQSHPGVHNIELHTPALSPGP